MYSKNMDVACLCTLYIYETLILKRVWQGINMTAVCNTPVNITPRINVGLISIRRLRRRLNISPTLTRVVMVQGLCPYVLYSWQERVLINSSGSGVKNFLETKFQVYSCNIAVLKAGKSLSGLGNPSTWQMYLRSRLQFQCITAWIDMSTFVCMWNNAE